MNQSQIAAQLGISQGRVCCLLRRGNVTPKKRQGPISTLSTAEADGIISFIKSSRESRRLTYLELASRPFKLLGVSEPVIQKKLWRRGYRRHPSHAEPPMSVKTWVKDKAHSRELDQSRI